MIYVKHYGQVMLSFNLNSPICAPSGWKLNAKTFFIAASGAVVVQTTDNRVNFNDLWWKRQRLPNASFDRRQCDVCVSKLSLWWTLCLLTLLKALEFIGVFKNFQWLLVCDYFVW